MFSSITDREPAIRLTVTVGLLVLLAQTVARAGWNTALYLKAPAIRPRRPLFRAVPKRENSSDESRGADQLHLFGEAPPLGKENEIKAPESSLALVLKGIIAAEPMDAALAIIAPKNGKGEDLIYRVGDQLPTGGIVERIEPRRVLIRRQGRIEALYLQANKATAAAGGVRALGDGRNWQVDGAFLVRQLDNIADLSSHIDWQPYVKGGRQQGFRIGPSSKSPLLHAMGLQPGDVIYEVNGIWVKDVKNAWRAYQEMKKADVITLAVGRDGRRKKQVYTISR